MLQPSAHAFGSPQATALPAGATEPLEPLVANVEQRLGALADSLRERDVQVIEQQAQELHRALARAVECFMHAARHGGVPEPLRLRLARASAQLARQREALARATAALDRAIDVLMPGAMPAGKVYGASGLAEPLHRGGTYSA
jgi:exonuclease VII large subunit